MITFDEFAKIEIKVGKILSAEKVPDTDKLLKLSVDFGLPATPIATVQLGGEPVAQVNMTEMQREVRQIISGISAYFPDPAVLVGRKCMFVTNLEPRKIRGLESNGMLFAVSTPDGKFSLLEPNSDIPEGTKAK
jgi:methionyl-tRNA synthetase